MTIRRFVHTSCPRYIRHRTTTDIQLRALEHSVSFVNEAVSRIDVCQVAANRPIEDYHSAGKCLSSNAFLVGVFDGHGGAACSRHVSARLFDYMCASVLDKHVITDLPLSRRLEWLFSSGEHRLPSFLHERHMANVERYLRSFKNDVNLTTVRKAIQAAFNAMDEDIAAEALPNNAGRVDRLSASVAASGSCATVAHLRGAHLHVANVGDSAAVLGLSHSGSIAARQLSRPHCIDNDDEVQRIRSSHPQTESSTILKDDRLLGELFPLRAFGDVRYKWTADLQKVVMSPLGIQLPHGLLTPPYLTALPEVFYHKLTPNDKFLVLASDGLWDFLDCDTVTRLITDHTLGALTLSLYQPPPESTLREVLLDLEQRKLGESKKPLDDNSATHVIRHALGGVSGGQDLQYNRLRESLQLPPGLARQYRDDMTVIVVHFNEQFLRLAAEGDDPGGL